MLLTANLNRNLCLLWHFVWHGQGGQHSAWGKASGRELYRPPNGLKMPFWALVGKDLAKLPKYDLLLGFNPPGRGAVRTVKERVGGLDLNPVPPPETVT